MFLLTASTRFSLGATSTAATAAPGATGGFTLGGTPATQTGGLSFGGAPSGGFTFGTPAAAATSSTAPQTGGFTFGTLAATAPPATAPQTGGFSFGSGTSTGIPFGTPSTQPASNKLTLGNTGNYLIKCVCVNLMTVHYMYVICHCLTL